MTPIRQLLANELAAKMERHGVVIWDDPESAYEAVVDEVIPPGANVQTYDGSWFDLRHRLEKHLSGKEQPALIVYVPVSPSDPDPLEELRAIGSRFRITLPRLLKTALDGQITEQRLHQLGQQCSKIGEAEAALEVGEPGLDARLISVVGDSSTVAIATAAIAGVCDVQIAEKNLGDAVQASLAVAVGGAYEGLEGDELRGAAFRQIVLTILAEQLGELPDDLALTAEKSTAAQRSACRAVLERLQTDSTFLESYVDLAGATDQSLHFGVRLPWSDGLRDLDLTEMIEMLALGECFRLLEEGHLEDAFEIADCRLSSSWWVRPAAPNGELFAAQFRAVRALASLGQATAKPAPTFESMSEVMDWYAGVGWKVDSAYRRSEMIRTTSGAVLDELDELFHQTRKKYESWLDEVLRASAEVAAEVDVATAELQRSVHPTFVGNRAGQTAYVLVDALRYELGEELVERLQTVSDDVAIDAVLGTPPSITQVGMAAVLPGADSSFVIELDETTNRLAVKVGGNLIDGVKDRVKLLENAHGTIVDLLLGDVAQYSNKELKAKIDPASLVLVRSTEIDSDGEADQLAAKWGSFDVTLNVLQTAVAKLVHAGIQRVVITADHGFLAVRKLGEDRRVDRPPTGSGELHRRAWIGRGGTSSESTVKIPLSDFGISSDLDVITPRGLGVFSSGGALQFFHGGLSPQELIIPVITVDASVDSPEPSYRIELAVAGGRITTGIVAVTVSMSGDLFTRESRVRLQLTQDQDRVGVVVGGDGFDPSTETISAVVDASRVITLQVTANLVAGSAATLEVIDAATGVRLEALDVDVAANILLDEDLD